MSVELAFLNQLKKRVPFKTALLFFETKNWTAPFDCYGWVTLIGAGGSGASGRGSRFVVTGGAAGGTAKKLIKFKKGHTYSITIGAGGLGVSSGSVGEYVPGNDGGTTVFSDNNGLSFSATGGKGGTTGDGQGTWFNGAVGGIGIDGDFNFQGGGSGPGYTEGGTYKHAATGGGAVGLKGDGYPSGSAYGTSGYNAASGGAAVGAKSPDTTAGGSSVEGPGGSAYNLASATSADFISSFGQLLNVLGRGGNSNGKNGGPGAGSCGNGYPGIFAGSGGVILDSTSRPGGLGAGSGACAMGTGSSTTGKGGDGFAVIELFLATVEV